MRKISGWSLLKGLSETINEFSVRPSQEEMVTTCEKLINGSDGLRVAAIEAGTGTGKSFGYLAPSIAAAISKKKKLIISTGTVALQQQLWERDIPTILKANGLDMKVALAKGRGRFACSMKLRDIAADKRGSSLAERMASMYVQGTWRGDLDEWKGTIDQKTRQDITESGPGCLRKKCPNYDECPAYTSRKEASEADIIVSNHALTMLSLSSPQGGPIAIKPEESIIVFDEAHHIDTVLKESFSVDIGINSHLRWAAQAPEKVASMFGAVDADGAAAEILKMKEWKWLVGELKKAAVGALRLHYRDSNGTDIHRFQFESMPGPILESMSSVSKAAGIIAIKIDRLAEQDQSRIDANPAVQSQIREVTEKLYSLAAAAESLVKVPDPDKPNAVWIEKLAGKNEPAITIKKRPLDVSQQMQNILWDKAHASILTSATMTALGEFTDFAKRVGLDTRSDVIYKRLDSPFSYKDQGEVNLFPMRSEPTGKDAKEFESEVIERLPQQLVQARGTLVLFTSRGMMKRVLKAMPAAHRRKILCQDEHGKSELIARHKHAIDDGSESVIFGLASLAEGLDLPGKYLEHVIITKLQFGSPDDPVFQAHSEYLQAHNRNPFFELALTDASVKLVQAVGRLIRTDTDVGRVTIMDKRITTKRYGQQLLGALPPLRVVSTDEPIDFRKFAGRSDTLTNLSENTVAKIGNSRQAYQGKSQPIGDELPMFEGGIIEAPGQLEETRAVAGDLRVPPSIFGEEACFASSNEKVSAAVRSTPDQIPPPSII